MSSTPQTDPWSEEHSRLVATTAPIVEETSAYELDRAWARIAAAVDESERVRRPRRSRRLRLLLGAGVTALAVGAAGVAAAEVYSAHTGRGPIDAEDLRLGGPGERLDPAAPDYAAVVGQLIRDVPFPSDEARSSFVAAETASDQRGAKPGETAVSAGAVRFWSARSAVCAWADQWAAALGAGDAPATARAAGMLERAPAWPAVTELDPRQTIEYEHVQVVDPVTGRTTVQRLADNTEAGYFPLIRDAVRAADVDALGAVLAQWGSCSAYGADMSHLPQAEARD